MRLLFIGDIVGRDGRDAVARYLPDLRNKLKLDGVILNADNAANGLGVTEQNCIDFFALGVDCVTTGNHVWDKREIIPYFDREPRLIRAVNFPAGTIGNGHYVFQTEGGQRVLVIHALARVFMDPLDCPFTGVDAVLKSYQLGRNVDAIFVDFHGEASSEKMAFGHYLDGRVTAVVGTHTHIPTADCHVLNSGTGFQSDAGMTGNYDSVIGVKKEVPIHRFVKQTPTGRMSPAEGEATFCGTYIETAQNGLCARIEPVILGPRLRNYTPSV